MSKKRQEKCPTCGHIRVTYQRSISFGQVKALAVLVRASERSPDGWVKWVDEIAATPGMPPSAAGGGDAAKLILWGLVERRLGIRDDGSKRTGWARPTGLGKKFLLGQATVPKYLLVEENLVVGRSDAQVSVEDCLGKFDYSELTKLREGLKWK